MNAYHLTVAVAAAGLFLATTPASATPLATTSPAPMGVAHLDSAVEPVYHRRAARRHAHRYHRYPTVTFGYAAPVFTPYYAYPYPRVHYPYRTYGYPYGYPYAHPYGVAPSFGFGFHISR